MVGLLSPAIEVNDIRKTYPQPRNLFDVFVGTRSEDVHALNGISLEVKRGELFGILGPNGAGKTTLTKILCTLTLPTSGSAKVNGYDILKEETEVRSSVGLISGEERSFYWKLSGRQNLMFFALLHNFSRYEARHRVEEVLERVNLRERADSRFETYSTGMKQKMAIARGLLNDPEILFMDEPTRSLDPNAAREIRDFIKKETREGKTIFLTTHNMYEADELCDRVAIIDKGKLKSQGSVEELKKIIGEKIVVNIDVKKDPTSAFTYLDEKIEKQDLSEDLVRLKIRTTRDSLPEIITAIVSARGKIVACNTEKPSLEEVFEKLTKGDKSD